MCNNLFCKCNINLCTQSSLEIHLGCFQYLGFIIKSAINIVGHVSLYFGASFWYMPSSSCIFSSSGRTSSYLLRKCQTNFQSGCTRFYSDQQWKSSPFSSYPKQHVLVLNPHYSECYEVESQGNFDLHSLITKDVEHFSSCFSVTWDYLFENYLFTSQHHCLWHYLILQSLTVLFSYLFSNTPLHTSKIVTQNWFSSKERLSKNETDTEGKDIHRTFQLVFNPICRHQSYILFLMVRNAWQRDPGLPVTWEILSVPEQYRFRYLQPNIGIGVVFHFVRDGRELKKLQDGATP